MFCAFATMDAQAPFTPTNVIAPFAPINTAISTIITPPTMMEPDAAIYTAISLSAKTVQPTVAVVFSTIKPPAPSNVPISTNITPPATTVPPTTTTVPTTIPPPTMIAPPTDVVITATLETAVIHTNHADLDPTAQPLPSPWILSFLLQQKNALYSTMVSSSLGIAYSPSLWQAICASAAAKPKKAVQKKKRKKAVTTQSGDSDVHI
jgi:hypothetical protein